MNLFKQFLVSQSTAQGMAWRTSKSVLRHKCAVIFQCCLEKIRVLIHNKCVSGQAYYGTSLLILLLPMIRVC